jgi:predicted MFS family arabinose efflux permease
MTFTFAGGAAGSVLGTVTYHAGGWTMTALAGAGIGLIALALFALERWGAARR